MARPLALGADGVEPGQRAGRVVDGEGGDAAFRFVLVHRIQHAALRVEREPGRVLRLERVEQLHRAVAGVDAPERDAFALRRVAADIGEMLARLGHCAARRSSSAAAPVLANMPASMPRRPRARKGDVLHHRSPPTSAPARRAASAGCCQAPAAPPASAPPPVPPAWRGRAARSGDRRSRPRRLSRSICARWSCGCGRRASSALSARRMTARLTFTRSISVCLDHLLRAARRAFAEHGHDAPFRDAQPELGLHSARRRRG